MAISGVYLTGVVLVVDDDDTFRGELVSILENVGLAVISMPSAIHATKFMQNQPWNWYPALVFTDLVMGGLGGYQFIRRLAELYPKREIPVIVTSKLNSGLDVAEAEIAGADAYLIKPIEAETVIETIKIVMNKKKSKMILKDAKTEEVN